MLSLVASLLCFWLWYAQYLRIDFDSLGRRFDAEAGVVHTDSAFAWAVPAVGFLAAAFVQLLWLLRRRRAERDHGRPAPAASLHLRPYEARDWPRLQQIHDAARAQELAASGLAAAFLSLEATAQSEGLFDGPVWVAEREGVVAGFVALHDGEMSWLYVDPAAQRSGVGRALVRHAQGLSPRGLRTEVLVGNEAALRLYRSVGFRVDRRVDGHLEGNERYEASGWLLRWDPTMRTHSPESLP